MLGIANAESEVEEGEGEDGKEEVIGWRFEEDEDSEDAAIDVVGSDEEGEDEDEDEDPEEELEEGSEEAVFEGGSEEEEAIDSEALSAVEGDSGNVKFAGGE